MNEPIRADLLLVSRKLAASRERAQGLIEAGLVYADQKPVHKCSQKLDPEAPLEVRGEFCPYVSRGGFKLERALEVFHIDPAGRVCLDVGASTGGFTDVLLKKEASCVYAVDVGSSQLDSSLRDNPQVVCMEKTNARTLTEDMFPIRPELAVMDVSFISVLLIFPALARVLPEDGRLVSLIKPQFEGTRSDLGKNGIIRDSAVHERVLQGIRDHAPESGWHLCACTFSPITGTEGNTEFLGCFQRNPGTYIDNDAIRRLVREAHAALKKGQASSEA